MEKHRGLAEARRGPQTQCGKSGKRGLKQPGAWIQILAAHVADHAIVTQLPCTGHMTDHALALTLRDLRTSSSSLILKNRAFFLERIAAWISLWVSTWKAPPPGAWP